MQITKKHENQIDNNNFPLNISNHSPRYFDEIFGKECFYLGVF